MYQYDHPTDAVDVMPTPPAAGSAGYMTDSLVGEDRGSIVQAHLINVMMLELLNILAVGGVTPSRTTHNQVAESIQNMIDTALGVLSDYVTLTGAQTLTNKTLTSPAINTPTVNGGAMSVAGDKLNTLDPATAGISVTMTHGATFLYWVFGPMVFFTCTLSAETPLTSGTIGTAGHRPAANTAFGVYWNEETSFDLVGQVSILTDGSINYYPEDVGGVSATCTVSGCFKRAGTT